MFRVKICGITRVEDAVAAVEAGADALGLNFAPPSPRAIDPASAQNIAAAVRGRALLVGVFVNADLADIQRLVRQVPLDAVQLHGDESPQAVADLSGVPVIKAFRLGDAGLSLIASFQRECHQLGRLPDAVLLDAFQSGSYGGTGKTVDWSHAAEYHGLAGEFPALPPLILAGGLRATNVAEAVQAVRPHGVDTASGVESSPGVKDLAQLRAFLAAGRAAFGMP